MGNRIVVVIEYDADPYANTPLSEAMEEVKVRMHHPDKPNIKVVMVYAAIDDVAQQILSLFNQKEGVENERR